MWNTLIRGNTSVVGPRPVLQEELDKYYTEQKQKLLLSLKPSLTGYWQAYARNNVHYSTDERQKMESYYEQYMSLWLDIRILAVIVGAVLRKSEGGRDEGCDSCGRLWDKDFRGIGL